MFLTDWYSDPGEEDELVILDGLDDENGQRRGHTHEYFRKEEWNMKSKTLVRSLERLLYRKCVFDIHFIRNEAARITSKCKNEACNWRIHASTILVVGG
ncbi:hypothetical protein BUALT_Bualt12G0145100 [Buddleja alternifolia]|uniref:Transposase MuDR plant domain-containing protein n=1 Tax=Buddleja alternifolia TaxID=168488 RepID=A0AAV6WSM6_9LAMI|nr:hypothetical protein BUALT_Bualt12G0145100 [Buddleja alternifolia]